MQTAILIVSFGTTDLGQLERALMGCVKSVQDQFPHYETYYAFSSEVVIKRLRELHGIEVPRITEALETLVAKGYDCVYVQPLHLMAGKEYTKVQQILEAYQDQISTQLGLPLLLEEELGDVAQSMIAHTADSTDFHLWIGHGSDHEAHAIYEQLALQLQGQDYCGMLLTLGDVDQCEAVTRAMSQKGIDKLRIHPLMLVAGNHLMKDISGEQEGTWQYTLGTYGIRPEIVTSGIGEYPWLHRVIHRRIHKLIQREL